MFIKKINLSADLTKLKEDISNLLLVTSWEPYNQIGLKYRPDADDIWSDSLGSIYDRDNDTPLAEENEFTEWNQYTPAYTRDAIEELQKLLNIKIGRVRYMLLKPKTGLTLHKDREVRYHIVIETNPDAYVSASQQFISTNDIVPIIGMNYHLPADGYWYQVDTRRRHHVYNGGKTDRIHLVVCGV
jgi:hypothetical protein